MFSCMSVCPQGGPHVGIIYGMLDSSRQHLVPLDIRHRTPGPVPPASDIWWPLLETCLNLFTRGPHPHPISSDIRWSLKHIRFTSGRYASYWNAFLLILYSNTRQRNKQNDSLAVWHIATVELLVQMNKYSWNFSLASSNLNDHIIQNGAAFKLWLWVLKETFKVSLKIFVITLKGLEPATSCVRDQDATTAPVRHIWEKGSLNWPQFMRGRFIRLTELAEFTLNFRYI